MDHIDREITEKLQQDGRATNAAVGEAVGLPVSTVNDRVRRLVANGVISGWSARVNPKAVGLDVLAFVFVLLDRPERTQRFVKTVTALPNVQECHHVTGEWSYLLKVRARSTGQLESLLAERIKSVKGVVRTLTIIALSSPKETACVPTTEEEG